MQSSFKTKGTTYSKFWKTLEPIYKPLTFNKLLILGFNAAICVVSAHNWSVLLGSIAVFSSLPTWVLPAISLLLFLAVQYQEVEPALMTAAQDSPKTLMRRMVSGDKEQLEKDAKEEFRQHSFKIMFSKLRQIFAFLIDICVNWFAAIATYGAAPISGFSALIATGSIAAISVSWFGLIITLLATFFVPMSLEVAIQENKYEG